MRKQQSKLFYKFVFLYFYPFRLMIPQEAETFSSAQASNNCDLIVSKPVIVYGKSSGELDSAHVVVSCSS